MRFKKLRSNKPGRLSNLRSSNLRSKSQNAVLQFEQCEPRQMLSRTWQVGELNDGVASSNRADGLGYMMFSEVSIKERFDRTHRNAAEHFIPVRFDDNQWQYNNNKGWVKFDPATTDVLVAQIDFTQNTTASLENVNSRVGGMQAGYDSGDILVIAGKWNGMNRPEEFTVEGTHFTTFTTGDDVLEAGLLNYGVAIHESTNGDGYLIYSERSLPLRFRGSHPYQAEHFFAARTFLGQWQYATERGWRFFTPASTDLIVAELDFETDSVKLWKGASHNVGNIDGGFYDGDITVVGGQWNNAAVVGQFQVFGSYMNRYDKNTTAIETTPQQFVPVSTSASGIGYMMYTVESVRERFSGFGLQSLDNFFAVQQDGSQWQYNNGQVWTDFDPAASDVIVATLDFNTGIATGLEGTALDVDGVPMGYVDGDLVMESSYWNSGVDFNRLDVEATYIQTWQRDPIGPMANGVLVMEDAVGSGYLLYSQLPVQSRFDDISGSQSAHFVAVKNDGLVWQYNNGIEWVEFSAAPSDRLVATIDFDDQEIEDLTNQHGLAGFEQGIRKGYQYSDFRFEGQLESKRFGVQRYFVLGTHMLSDPTMNGTSFEEPLLDIAKGLVNYHDSYTQLPVHAIYSANDQPLLSWRVSILPFIGYGDLFDRFDLQAAWNSPQNMALLDEMPAIYSNPELTHRTSTVYQVVNHENSAFPLDPDASVRLNSLNDTLLVVEVDPQRATEWTRPVDLIFSESDPLDGLGGGFGNSFDAITTDRSLFDVYWSHQPGNSTYVIPASIDPIDFQHLMERFDQPVNFDTIVPFNSAEANLKTLGLAALNHHSAYQRLPARANFDDVTDQPLLSWRVHLLPWLGYQNLYSQFILSQPWDSPHNIQLIDQMPTVYDSPGLPENMTNFTAIVGAGTAFPTDGSRVTLETIRDEPGRTILFTESSSARHWTRPDDITHNPVDPRQDLGYSRSYGTHVVMASGKTGLISNGVSDEVLNNLFERNDMNEIAFHEYSHYNDVQNNLRAAGIATHNYHDVRKRLPTHAIYEDPFVRDTPLLSWRVAILPYMGYQHLYDRFNLDEPWDSEHNLSLLPLMPIEFAHPKVGVPGMTNSLAVVGESETIPGLSTVFPSDGSKNTLERISNLDGTTRTILYVEANADHAVQWTRPMDITFDYDNPWNGLGEINPTGFNTVFADASGRYVSSTISAEDLRNMLLMNDGF